jgi:hypothetical protein
LSVLTATIERDDSKDIITFRIVLSNFGEASTAASVKTSVFSGGHKLNVESEVPDNIGFAPHQQQTVTFRLERPADVDAVWLGRQVFGVRLDVQYRLSSGGQAAYVYVGRFDAVRRQLNTIKSGYP